MLQQQGHHQNNIESMEDVIQWNVRQRDRENQQ